MITTARQLKDLIRNLSKKKSADAQILMRNYMMERFLERIALSDYKDRFILKGGMLVAAMVGLDARATMDMDATIKGGQCQRGGCGKYHIFDSIGSAGGRCGVSREADLRDYGGGGISGSPRQPGNHL